MSVSVSTWSKEFEVVLRIETQDMAPQVASRILIADFATSAPLTQGAITTRWSGPVAFSTEWKPGNTPGHWTAAPSFSVAGEYDGSIEIITETKADLIGIPNFPSTPSTPADETSQGTGPHLAVGIGSGLAGGVLIGLLLGWIGFRRRWWAVLALMVAVGSAGRVFAHGGEEHAAPPPPVATSAGGIGLPLESQFLLELGTVLAAPGSVTPCIVAAGVAVAPPGEGAAIISPAFGQYGSVAAVQPGSQVAAGELLATITETLTGSERASLINAESEARIQVAASRSDLAIAEQDLARVAIIGDTLSGRDRLAREQAVVIARKAFDEAQIIASVLGSKASVREIRAPISGVVASAPYRTGDSVQVGDPLFRLVGAKNRWAEVRIGEGTVASVELGSTVRLLTESKPERSYEGRVIDTGHEVNPATGQVRVLVSIETMDGALLPGTALRAHLPIRSAPPADGIAIPIEAVVQSMGEPIVFVKLSPELFEPRPVRLGVTDGTTQQIVTGLAPGERVVVRGLYTLRTLAGR